MSKLLAFRVTLLGIVLAGLLKATAQTPPTLIAHRGAGLYPELKSPALYRARRVDMARMFADSVKRLRLDATPGTA